MRFFVAQIFAVILLTVPAALGAQALDALDARTQAFIRDEGLAVAVVENCTEPRFEMAEPHQTRFEAMVVMLLAEGYTKEQIRASLEAQGAFVREGGAAQYLRDNGVKPGDLESLCRFAQRQIQSGETFSSILSIR